ncbi:signal peptidase II [Sulfitobacter sp. HNIBRBA3233]|uniref:signal peptidase II n=1 Tax=Sulfitobacter marinivivus TaxID=3158558 RepID=UPI0032DF6B5E
MRLVFSSTLLAFLIDQFSKYAVIHSMGLARVGSIDVLPPVLNFRYGENRGINFGLFDGSSDASRWFLIVLALVICAAVVIWAYRSATREITQLSAGLLIGGALGNVLDRLVYGYVLDFLNVSCCGINNPFVFNVADIFIFVGAIGLVFFADGDKPRGGAKGKKAG